MYRKTTLEVLIERFRGTDLDGLDILINVAIDLSFTGDHQAEKVWTKLHPQLWEHTQNPWVILKTVSLERLKQFLADPVAQDELKLLKTKQTQTEATWFAEKHPDASLSHVVYFCMEFMLAESLPIYSGGLGNVAGDQLKAANDLGIPVTGVGLLYQQGYFRQVIGPEGTQQALYPYNDPDQLPVVPYRRPDGEWFRLKVDLPGYALWLRVWEARVGTVRLLLLDSNDAANYPAHRCITSELYGGDKTLRLQQEMILGICGWRLLEAVGIAPEVCHLNEGHSAFAILERAKTLMDKERINFWEALSITRAGNVFTTHTAVTAGFDLFEPQLMATYFMEYAVSLGISFRDLMSLGRLDPGNDSEPFNLAYLAIRGSGAVNGVSRLHGEVSRHLFQPLFPRWPAAEIPIGHVTNGVHMRSWDSEAAEQLWAEAVGAPPWTGKNEDLGINIHNVPDEKIWDMRSLSRNSLIQSIRKERPFRLAASGAPDEQVEHARNLFNPDVLTIGFARRFATYKRATLLLHDQERLLNILTRHDMPVQLIISGKAHPADQQGKALIKAWLDFSMRKEARDHVVFLSDYDMNLARRIVQGVDVWLNNPRRPWEASGTSGMKVLVNGGLNLSSLDGWWNEAYDPSLGWAIGDGQEHPDNAEQDAREAEHLYQLLENEVAPCFYQRDSRGIPTTWIGMVKNSMAKLTAEFSVSRTVMEYTEKYYLPAASAYNSRLSGKRGAELAGFHQTLRERWPHLSVEELLVETIRGKHRFNAKINLASIPSQQVRVELFAEGIDGKAPLIVPMKAQKPTERAGTIHYQGEIDDDRDQADYTVRIIPTLKGVAIPLENNLIYWQR